MPSVQISSDGRGFTGGLAEVEVEADTVGRLIQALEARFPGMGDYVSRRMAVVIDGEIHVDALGQALSPTSEVVLIPKIGGG